MGYTVEKNTDKYYLYRKKYKSYKSLCKDIQKDYDNASIKVNTLDSSVTKLKSASTTNDGDMHGRPIDLFNDKSARYYNLSVSMVSEFKSILVSISNRLQEAINKRDNYKSKMDYEEAHPDVEYYKWWWED